MYIPGYRIIRKINHGGMSTVYLAIQESVGRVVALKVMSPALNGDPSFSERFQREANIVGQLSHPNIVSIYDIGRHENLNYIAMDYLPGGSIHDKMLSGFGPDNALEILREMASALAHAHDKGYIHRDIKPENILFRDGGSAVLTDFGVALARNGGPRSTRAGTVVGTPHYMSPEQTRGKNSDGRSDLYSLGIVFYEMLTGAVPYQGDEPVAIALKHLASPLPKLPTQYRRYQDILDKLLDKEADKRYQSGRELMVDIELLQLKMREFGDGDNDGQNLSHQFQTLTQTIWWRLAAGASALGRYIWTKICCLRFSRQRGFYQAIPEISALNDIQTQQHTLMATRFQKTTKQPSALQRLLKIPTPYRLLTAGVVSILLLGLIVFNWRGESQPADNDTIQQASANTSTLTAQTDANSSAATSSSNASSAASINTSAAASNLTNNRTDEPMQSVSATSPNATELTKSDNTTLNINADPRVMLPNNLQPNSAVIAQPNSDDSDNETDKDALAQLSDNASNDDDTEETTDDNLEQAASSSAATFSFTVAPTPSNARVRIMNIREKYTPGMPLKPGRYRLEVTAPGYRKYLRWVNLDEQPLTKTVTLTEQRAIGSVFNSKLTSGGKGPAMVVIPAGSFAMGGPDANASPVHNIYIKKRFAVSQHEITFDEYELFAKQKGMPLPGDNRWGRGDRPVINVSWEEADMYAKWLSSQTNLLYRLPSEAEWEYIAKSGKAQPFVWGDNEKDAAGNANCRRYCDSDFTGFFKSKSAPVGSFKSNDFGVYDMAGNVSEWVADCYRPNYDKAGSIATAYNHSDCAARVIRGGSLKSDAAETNTYSRQSQPQYTYHEDTGIRLVAELPN
ncbi:bifunctional serine/threonine-protein kinase/formylglycine-generating enzyme family protein [Gilvimarinus polysaccharolyticus]|uniref:bifunctional serine/threonine-protein kinase/formylglycine-generating enzyme family protein n=1 Tax=Gilvimarinus polysaccharolyticus TaxID=863921 RepID=UPI00067382FC|nr:bifunctional serine/threonine-protein kinase/formylglycine-generating enzyme family protein [Gilvimarinus polysaccharolyticus]